MSAPGRPKRESFERQREGRPIDAPGRPKRECFERQREGRPVRRVLIACGLAAVLVGAALANEAVPTLNDPVTAKREVELAKQLRCLVCQNETIADSRADLAVDLRNKLREQIAAGKTDREIITFMTDRYGDFVLYRPPLKATTVLLWAGPFLLLGTGVLVGWRVVRARAEVARQAPLSAADRERAERLLRGEGEA
jgi:cytochrome c-type biogenesis protein CcmH